MVAGAVVVEHQRNGFGGAIAAPIAEAIMQAFLPPASKLKNGVHEQCTDPWIDRTSTAVT